MTRRPLPPSPSSRGTSKPVLHRRYRRLTSVLTALLLVGATTWVVLWWLGRGEDPRAQTERALAQLAAGVEEYRQRTGALPADLTALVGLETCYDGGVCPEDGYGTMIQYLVLDGGAGSYRLRSAGPDRRPATSDDLVWPPGTTWPDEGATLPR